MSSRPSYGRTGMSEVVVDITMTLDGFVTGPDAGPGRGLGRGGDPIHAWVFDPESEVDQQVLRDSVERSGAVILGRNLFDVVDAPDGWSDEMGYGADHAARPPMFVVTHRPPAEPRLPYWTFVGSIEEAIEQAKAVAGDKDVFVMGGGDVIAQVVDLGLADRIQIHLSPVLVGEGTPLFRQGRLTELEQVDVRVSPHATHLTYRPKR
jgi:dihydrofolate reductase